MKALIAVAIAATVLASAFAVQAADRKPVFDGAKFFDDIATRSGQ